MTPFSNVTERFQRKIKKDREFFDINNVDMDELMEIVNQYSNDLLEDAVNELQPLVSIKQMVNFLDKDNMMESFRFDLTSLEEDMISDLMYVKLLDEEMVKLKTMQKYLGDDIKVFSPAEERNSFIKMIDYKRKLALNKIANYNTRNRLTGEFLLPY